MVAIVKINHWNQAEATVHLNVDADAAWQIQAAVGDQTPLLIGGVLIFPLSAEGRLSIIGDDYMAWQVHGRLMAALDLGEDFRNSLRNRVAEVIRDSGCLGDQEQHASDLNLRQLHGISEDVIDAMLTALGHDPLPWHGDI